MSNYYYEISTIMSKFLKKFFIMNNEGIKLANFSYKFTFQEIVFIMEIGKNRTVFLKELIRNFENDRKFVLPIVNKLVKAGFVEKRKSEVDGRIVVVKLTVTGDLAYEFAKEKGGNLLEFILRDLSINEEKAILKYFSKILQTTVERPSIDEIEKNLTIKWGFKVKLNYLGWGASTGQTFAQAPQSIQADSSIT